MADQAVVDAVIARIEAGESENSACKAEGINRATFRSAALRCQAADKYAQALSALAHAQAEALEQALDDMKAGKLDPQIGRIEVDARKWFASKFLPKQYGDKVQAELSGPNGGPVETSITVRLVQPKEGE